jgi:hypothetical protein
LPLIRRCGHSGHSYRFGTVIVLGHSDCFRAQ